MEVEIGVRAHARQGLGREARAQRKKQKTKREAEVDRAFDGKGKPVEEK